MRAVTSEDVLQRVAQLPDGVIAKAHQGDNGLWYATVATDHRWVGDADFSTCRSSSVMAIEDCAIAVRADLRGEGKYAPHWSPYDVEYRLLPHWEQRFKALKALLTTATATATATTVKGGV